MTTHGEHRRTTRSAATPPLLAVAVVLVVIATLGVIRPGTVGGAGPTAYPSPTPASTPSPSPSPSPTPTPTPSPSPTPTPSPSPSPVPTSTPTPSPTPVPSFGPPPCEYLDIPTPRPGYPDWPITLLDTVYRVPAEYAPGDLVDSGTAGVNGGYPIRALIADDLRAMAADARSAGVPIMLVSGYRSHAQQEKTFAGWVAVGGYEQALRTSARPGHSEHQLGTAIDVSDEGGAPPWEYADWGATPAGTWMARNAWRYGFVMSYPAGSFDRTCYDYEPWHYRFVGRDLAGQIVGSGQTPREVIWELQ